MTPTTAKTPHITLKRAQSPPHSHFRPQTTMKSAALILGLGLASSGQALSSAPPGSLAVARGAKQICYMSEPKELEWKNNYSFAPGVAAVGDSTIIMKDDGTVRFRTHFRTTGAPDYKYSVACALRDDAGRVYRVQGKGEIWGSLSGKNREHKAESATNHGDVKKHWGHIVKGNRKMHCDAKVNVDDRRLMEEVAGILKQYGSTGEVVSIII
jgi:hypothetical protein